MIEQELQRKFEDFRELGIPPYVPREGKLHIVDRMVSTVIGARRAGKSFRVLQAADELAKQGVIKSLDQVCAVDFDNRGKPVLAVQVSMDISLPDTLRRELDPLVSTARYFGTKENLVVTLSQEQRIERDGVVVHAVPAWKWLLDKSPNSP